MLKMTFELKDGDCLFVAMQALTWGYSAPFSETACKALLGHYNRMAKGLVPPDVALGEDGELDPYEVYNAWTEYPKREKIWLQKEYGYPGETVEEVLARLEERTDVYTLPESWLVRNTI